MIYPKIDRSDFTPNFNKTVENDILDIGWAEGTLSDGRPFRMEMWAQDQISRVTFFFSTQGLEHLTRKSAEELLERENLVKFISSERSVYPRDFIDPSGNSMWSVNVLVGDEDETFIEGGPAVRPYK